jgi:broad specificity phosphatase PhoE
MRYLEVRRHTMRVKPGQHLSQEGVDLARRIGNMMGPFEIVLTSTLYRAYETALAMGFAVNDQLDELCPPSQDVEIDVGAWDAGFAAYGAAYKRNGAVRDYAEELAQLWHSIAIGMTDKGLALVITHGGVVEAGTVGCLPGLNYSGLGEVISYCEGVRLSFDGNNFIDAEVLRVK